MASSLTKENMCYLLYKKTKGFTLIELLVVIAIIGLLISVLLPGLRVAKSQAKSVVCRTNLHQLALANIGYAIENDDHFIAAASDFLYGTGGLNRWHGVRETFNDAFDPTKGLLAPYLGGGKVKECPGNVKFHEGETWNQSFEKGCGGYGYNMSYIGSTLWRGYATFDEWKECYAKTTKSTQVAQSSATLMFADTAHLKDDKLIEYSFAEARYWLSWDGEADTNAVPQPTIHFRHRLKANVAWVDGHIGSLDMPEKYDSTTAYLETFRELSLGMVEPLDNSLFDLR